MTNEIEQLRAELAAAIDAAKDAQDTRDRLAVEVQALREALRRIGALHSETRTGIRGEPKGETWSAFADRLQREAAAALSAPSESERVLAARDERTRRAAFDELLGGTCDSLQRVDLRCHGHCGYEGMRGCEVVKTMVDEALAATPPSAASGRPNPFELCFHDVPRRTCPTCAASGKGAT
jgi:hypothetical protein